jgi:transposase
MIAWSANCKVLLYTELVDMRKGMGKLAQLAQALSSDGGVPTNCVFIFRGRTAYRVKLLWFDGTGLCMMSKQLECSQFVWPTVIGGSLRLTAWQLSALLEGLDWRGDRRVKERLVVA